MFYYHAYRDRSTEFMVSSSFRNAHTFFQQLFVLSRTIVWLLPPIVQSSAARAALFVYAINRARTATD
jgi:hypothetical protein